VDLVRDPVVKLNSKDGNAWNSPIDLTGVLDINTTDESSSIDIATDNDDSNEDTTEALLVSDNQNININDSSSDIAADDSNMTTTEQPPPPIEKEQDLPTTVESAESEPANKELVIGTWNIQNEKVPVWRQRFGRWVKWGWIWVSLQKQN